MTNLQCILSFRDFRCFDAISVLSRFTHFCVEQSELNILVCGAKMTNMQLSQQDARPTEQLANFGKAKMLKNRLSFASLDQHEQNG